MFWLAEQGLVFPIIILPLPILMCTLMAWMEVKGVDAMLKKLMKVSSDVLYAMSVSLTGDTLLAKTLQCI